MYEALSKKVFIVDTSVILFDSGFWNKFNGHDIIIPISVIEELDQFKTGSDTKNFHAREFIRFLDSVYTNGRANTWINLGTNLSRLCIGVNLETSVSSNAVETYGDNNDSKILNLATVTVLKNPDSKIILVTKDINLRIKARTLGLVSEDYLSGKVEDLSKIKKESNVIKDVDPNLVEEIYKLGYTENISILGETLPSINSYFVITSPTGSTVLAQLVKLEEVPRLIKVNKKEKGLFGITPKNSEQTFASDALLNPDIKLVALEGVAGTGKTLLSLAAALENSSLYKNIILARPLVTLSNRDNIGFIPGDLKEKLDPYMQPLFDNLNFIKSKHKVDSSKGKFLKTIQEEGGSLSITALAFIRGRSLSDTFFIIDEAQNLTPHEIKTIVTRAGENTKIVFTGDINQIDTPYMDQKSNGLTYLIDRFLGQSLFSHVKLVKGERSELANLANKLL